MDPSALLMIALFVALGYFMLVRPARTQQKKQAALMSELEPGQRVTTQIGVYGTLVELGDVQARVEVSPGVILTVDKRLVSGVVPRSRDEFWTYPDEPVEDQAVEDQAVEDQAFEDLVVEQDPDTVVEVQDTDVETRTDGTDERKA
jgi:preprotein translocase subunit YajC